MHTRTRLFPLLLASATAAVGLTACSAEPSPAPTETAPVMTSPVKTTAQGHDPHEIFLEDVRDELGLDPQAVDDVTLHGHGSALSVSAPSAQWDRLAAQGLVPDVSDYTDHAPTHPVLGSRLTSVFMCEPGTSMTPDVAARMRKAFGPYARAMPEASWAPGTVAVVTPASSAYSEWFESGHFPCG